MQFSKRHPKLCHSMQLYYYKKGLASICCPSFHIPSSEMGARMNKISTAIFRSWLFYLRFIFHFPNEIFMRRWPTLVSLKFIMITRIFFFYFCHQVWPVYGYCLKKKTVRNLASFQQKAETNFFVQSSSLTRPNDTDASVNSYAPIVARCHTTVNRYLNFKNSAEVELDDGKWSVCFISYLNNI